MPTIEERVKSLENLGMKHKHLGDRTATLLDYIKTVKPDYNENEILQVDSGKTLVLRTLAAAGVAAGLSLKGSDDTETTTLSITTVDLSTVGGLTIAINTPLLIICDIRTINSGSMALKINATRITSELAPFASSPGSGLLFFLIGPRDTNYFQCLFGVGSTSNKAIVHYQADNALIPNAEITDITITGKASSTSNTLASKNLKVYTLTIT